MITFLRVNWKKFQMWPLKVRLVVVPLKDYGWGKEGDSWGNVKSEDTSIENGWSKEKGGDSDNLFDGLFK